MSKVAPKIDEYLVSFRKHYVPKKLTFSPSLIGSPCQRKIFYQYLRTLPDFPPTSKQVRIFETGDALHKLVKSWIRNSVGFIDYRNPDGSIPIHFVTKEPDLEFPIYDETSEIKGKIDGVGILENSLYIYEIKSIKAEEFRKLKAPLKKHMLQGNTYAYVFEQGLKTGKYTHISELSGFTEVAGIIYLYINKDNSELKEFVLPKSELLLEEVMMVAFTIKEHAASQVLPEPTEDFCSSCAYRLKCSRNSLT